MIRRRLLKRLVVFAVLFALFAGFSAPSFARAGESGGTVVRVGWYESPFDHKDALGRRSGYAYEYQQEIAAYTGWRYEYVEGSWPELMQMLLDGTLDLMSDVSFTEERSERMLFSALPMGAEEYYLYVSPGNREIRAGNYSSLNGKRVGVNQGSYQAELFREWAKNNGVQAEVLELSCPETESVEMLASGELDLFLTVDMIGSAFDDLVPLCEIGSSDFFFAVNKDRPELLQELNAAMGKIHDTNRYYNQRLSSKYFTATGANRLLDSREEQWLAQHGAIRVGYLSNYLSFCAEDEAGKLTGALREYLDLAADCLAGVHLRFEPIAYPTAEAALNAVKRGEIDCMFPANLTDYDGEEAGVCLTQPLMRTDMSAVVRSKDNVSLHPDDPVVVAVNEGNTNYELFLADHFPNWQVMRYPDTAVCLQAIADEDADCLLISSYRFNNISHQCQKLGLVALSTGVEMDYSFALDRNNHVLYSILSKVESNVPDSAVNSALSRYFSEDARQSLFDILRENFGGIMAVVAAVLLVIVLLLVRSGQMEKKAREEQQLISATEFDSLTGLLNRSYFYEFALRMYQEAPDRPMDAVVLNIDRFHSVNATGGRAFGDRILQALGEEIRAYLSETEGVGGRSVADHFALYCRHEEDWNPLFRRLQARLDALSPDTDVLLRMGVMPWKEGMEPTLLFDRAQIACGMAKGSAERLFVFDRAAQAREEYEQRLLNELRHALENHEFEVFYQPKFGIQAEPPVLKSAEALVRWRHPQLGMIPPGDFIPLFERNGQISALDHYVWTEAAAQIARWRDECGVVIPVSVNLSRVEVLNPNLADTLDALLEKHALDRSSFKLEVTESAYIENADRVIARIEALRQRGYEIEMDDFGSGYSSLSMLSSMPIDVLKMDRAFIRNIEHDESDSLFVELILGIAKHLNIPVVAEGVETEAQFRLLKRLGCDLVQGYYFSRPLPAEEFRALLTQKSE